MMHVVNIGFLLISYLVLDILEKKRERPLDEIKVG
jgi:hypothetical protein